MSLLDQNLFAQNDDPMEEQPAGSGFGGGDPEMNIFLDEGGAGQVLSQYGRALCELDDASRGLGERLHRVLSGITPAEWAAVQPILGTFVRVGCVPESTWTYVPAANRVRLAAKSSAIELEKASFSQITRALSVYAGHEFKITNLGVAYDGNYTSGLAFGFKSEIVPQVADGFVTRTEQENAVRNMKLVFADWAQTKPRLPAAGKFNNGKSLPVTERAFAWMLSEYNKPNADTVQLAETIDKQFRAAKMHTRMIGWLVDPEFKNDAIDKDLKWVTDPNALERARADIQTRALNVLEECRKIRGTDNSDVERAIFYRCPNCPRALHEIAVYHDLIGDCKRVHFMGEGADVVKYFNGLPDQNEVELIIVHDNSYVGKFNDRVPQEAGFPTAGALKNLKLDLKKRVALPCQIPKNQYGWRNLWFMLKNGWRFVPGVSPHNGRFWLTNYMGEGDAKGEQLAVYWFTLGILVNYVRTACFLSVVPKVAAEIRNMLVGLYSVFPLNVTIKPGGNLIALEDDGYDLGTLSATGTKRKSDE